MLALAKTARRGADFGFLWYRELYLELSQQIQFPIELSLPWILAEHAARGGPGSDAVPADRLLAALPYAALEGERGRLYDAVVEVLSKHVAEAVASPGFRDAVLELSLIHI